MQGIMASKMGTSPEKMRISWVSNQLYIIAIIYIYVYIYTLYLIWVILPKLPFEWENDQPPGFLLVPIFRLLPVDFAILPKKTTDFIKQSLDWTTWSSEKLMYYLADACLTNKSWVSVEKTPGSAQKLDKPNPLIQWLNPSLFMVQIIGTHGTHQIPGCFMVIWVERIMKTHGKPWKTHDFEPTLHQNAWCFACINWPAVLVPISDQLKNGHVPYLPDLPMFKAHIGTGFHIAFHMLLACRLMGPLVGVDESQIWPHIDGGE